MIKMATSNTSEIGFEKRIGKAACVLRGNLDASEYKSIVLDLIFLKYISDRFEGKYQELKAEGQGFENEPKCRMAINNRLDSFSFLAYKNILFGASAIFRIKGDISIGKLC